MPLSNSMFKAFRKGLQNSGASDESDFEAENKKQDADAEAKAKDDEKKGRARYLLTDDDASSGRASKILKSR